MVLSLGICLLERGIPLRCHAAYVRLEDSIPNDATLKKLHVHRSRSSKDFMECLVSRFQNLLLGSTYDNRWDGLPLDEEDEVAVEGDAHKIAVAMGARVDGASDSSTFCVAITFSSIGSTMIVMVFLLCRRNNCLLYSNFGIPGDSPLAMADEDIIQHVGLDVFMLLSFEGLAMTILATLMVPAFALLPLHWGRSRNKANFDLLFRFSFPGTDDPVVVFAHLLVMYYVVFVTIWWLRKAKTELKRRRHTWYFNLAAPRVTSVLAKNIPPRYRTDDALLEFFRANFTDEAVTRAYVVRNTEHLNLQLDLLEKAKKKKRICGREETAVMAERQRLQAAKNTYDPEINSSVGFVTFASRLHARHAMREETIGDDDDVISLYEVGDPIDVVYEDYQKCSCYSASCPLGEWALVYIGWFCIFLILIIWMPLVTCIAAVTHIDNVQYYSPEFASWLQAHPIVHGLYTDVLGVAVLAAVMNSMPSVILVIIQFMFRVGSNAGAQLLLERLYFKFLLLFVLLITAIGHGFFATFFFLAQNPFKLFPLLANTIPTISHYYLSYVIFGWLALCVEMLRISVWAYKVLMLLTGIPWSSQDGTIDFDYSGQRNGTAVFMFVVILVFCSLSPLIIPIGFIYFLISRIVHGYLCCFAECPKADTGGEFWFAMGRQAHIGLFFYVLLMVGVLCSPRTGAPLWMAIPAVAYVIGAYVDFRTVQDWSTPPLQTIIAADTAIDSGEVPKLPAGPDMFVQSECEEVRETT